MYEAISFFSGMFAMLVVWYVVDIHPKTSPYNRGYREGYLDALEALGENNHDRI